MSQVKLLKMLKVESIITEIDAAVFGLVRDVYADVCQENEIDQLAKKLAQASIFESEHEENEINRLAKKLAHAKIFETECEENKIDWLAKKLSLDTLAEASNEIAIELIRKSRDYLAKKHAPATINEIEENGACEDHQLAKKLTPSTSSKFERNEATKNIAHPSENTVGQIETLVELGFISDNVNEEGEDFDGQIDIFKLCVSGGTNTNDISALANKFVGDLFQGVLTEKQEEDSEITSVAKSLIKNLLNTEVEDSALFTRLYHIVDEVFADVDNVNRKADGNIVTKDKQKQQQQQQQRQPQHQPLSKWRRFKKLFTCCWKPIVPNNDDTCQHMSITCQ